MSPNQALLTLHANYRKWYFAAQPDLDDAVGHTQTQVLLRSSANPIHARVPLLCFQIR